MTTRTQERRHGFTLVELLVTAGVVMLLVGILLPGLGRAREQARSTFCQSNIRQLALANGLYAQEFGGVYVPGASGIRQENLHRWHGVRSTTQEPFVPSGGPLTAYLGPDGAIQECPTFRPHKPGFETGNGGYGYNNAYVGVQTAMKSNGRVIVISDRAGTVADRIKHPGDTVMFTDSAFVNGQLIEYSFAEPRFHPAFASRADPSIHFRHAQHANVAWCDGSVRWEMRTHTWSSGNYPGDPDRWGIGWFGETDDNAWFDLR